MKNVESKKCRINRKLYLMLIIKYLFDFNEKKKKNMFITNDKYSQKKLYEKAKCPSSR